MFDPLDHQNLSTDDCRQLFQLAFDEDNGPFSRIQARLAHGFSMLVYLPGNCIPHAAEMIKKSLVDRWSWTSYGDHPGENQSIQDIWKSSSGITGGLKRWLDSRQGKEPAAIYQNLDFLGDGRGGIYPDIWAQTAVANLVAGTRNGVVLGLSDRDAGPLPGPIARPFSEQVWINEIPRGNFAKIMPAALTKALSKITETDLQTATRMIASRLRWSDPIRAFRIMDTAGRRQSTLPGILASILSSTRSVNFINPEEAYQGEKPKGFPASVLTSLENDIIGPFRKWASFVADTEQAWGRALAKLPPGLVLHGPPGTGKTLLARWVAKSIGLPVRTISGSEIRAGLWGDAEKNVRNLFQEVRRAAPCVLVMDDADDLLTDRATAQGGVASAERAVVNEFLQQLQGFYGALEGVLVILTTNRLDAIDKAVRERLALDLRIPYPLDATQVKDIMDFINLEFGFNLELIREDLAQHFLLPIQQQVVDTERYWSDDDYYSPREIRTAMRLLDGGQDSTLGGSYQPTVADLERVKEYYRRKSGERSRRGQV